MNKFLGGFGLFLMILSGMFLVLCVIMVCAMPAVGVPALAADFGVMYLGAYWMINGRRKNEGRDEVRNGTCAVCSAQGPVRYLEFKECRAYLVMRRERSIENFMCARCADQIYRAFNANNLKLGWWSLPGLIRTPMMLMFNHINRRRAAALTAGVQTASAVQAAQPGAIQ